ncbi:protein of unknown function UPF0182 [Beutenbergia cavernae DSM 12333]|uniref:UPF0182 protein Bcav_2885 n=1 Tax=Beutenbergia cavernae (strain ATCC BAA-8 / DSM 12333 / CCUG 43141 / JCM 11478 / NBRC 16432 / NCIMB 13614 / HKI 0122) TaxID=471853 RepID=C5BZ15_BEUC1|nr:UPF0182 family protein [Beutenbergia cavernae]ACQ81130.1 protein of unknown function UPF0182 [Beutenbergia cavernae DSM 12333]
MPTLVVLGVVIVGVLILAQLVTEWLWFAQVGYTDVLRTQWITRTALFLLGGGLMGGAVYLNLSLAYRNRPVYAPVTPEQQNLDRYREGIEPLRRVVLIGAPIVLGLFAGGAAAGQWQTVLLAFNAEQFGEVDPQFGIDLSFYLFTLPFLRFIVSFLMAVTFLAAIGAIVTHYLYGGLQVGGSGQKISRAARIHIGILAAVFTLLIAASYWLDRYSLLSKQGDRFDGAGYADISAVLPARTILAIIAVLVALMFVFASARGTWRLPAVGVALMVVSAIVIGGIYPALVQQFRVRPNAQTLESPYIQRNIDATLAAYGLEDIETQDYEAVTQAEPGALREDAETTASIRLMDPTIISPTFQQLQQIRQYYSFPENLSVDRYELEGESRDTVISVRELNLNGLGENQRNWVNDHTVYTHGFGVVAAYGNTPTASGQPDFFQGGIPSSGALGDYEPRIYFGQNSPTYSVVGAPEGTDPWEVDYPSDESEGEVLSTYSGDGGPEVSNPFLRLLFALRFGSQEILFSDRVTPESQILYDRDPHVRVGKVAPFLTLDNRAYPAVVDQDGDGVGEVVWIVDAYTTSNEYPYSARQQLEEATIDSLVAQQEGQLAQGVLPESINYIRNSVKAVVDAYDGSVTLYAWDENDPVLESWENVFPDAVRPMSEIDGSLMSHLRYPEDLFKVQRTLLNSYHVTDAGQFFAGSDFWRTPNDPTQGDANIPQPPYYLTLRMPGQDESSFSLTSSFILDDDSRNVMRGFAAVDADAGSEDGVRREGYGTIRMLDLPASLSIPGPGQVQNSFNTDPDAADVLNILDQQGSEVRQGNLLTLPLGGGLLYVQPVYAQASTGTQYPLLRYVLVAFGNEIGFATTLDEALDQVFGGDSGADAGDAGVDPTDPVEPPGDGEPTEEPTEEPTDEPTEEPTDTPGADDAQTRLSQALQDAAQAMEDSSAALAESDWTAYGEAQERLSDALERAIAAQEEIDAAQG